MWPPLASPVSLLPLTTALLLLAGPVLSQEQSAPPAPPAPLLSTADGRIETRHLVLQLSSGPSPAAPGARVTLAIDVTPRPRMHVYAPDQKDVIPVSLRLTPSPLVQPAPVKLPPSERYFFAPLDETQRVYSKPFRIEQPITLAGERAMRGAPDTLTVEGRLRYQACDDTICYLPQEVPLAWTLVLDRR